MALKLRIKCPGKVDLSYFEIGELFSGIGAKIVFGGKTFFLILFLLFI